MNPRGFMALITRMREQWIPGPFFRVGGAWAGEIIVNCGLVASPFFNLTVKSIYLFYRLAQYISATKHIF